MTGADTGWDGEIRHAEAGDADAVASLAAELAQSFEFPPEMFSVNYPALLASDLASPASDRSTGR
jgi:hypothetical protein